MLDGECWTVGLFKSGSASGPLWAALDPYGMISPFSLRSLDLRPQVSLAPMVSPG